MKWEAAAKLVAGPVGSTWKLTQHRMRARSVYGFARVTPKFTSFFPLWIADCGLRIVHRIHRLRPVPASRSLNRGDCYCEQFIGFGK